MSDHSAHRVLCSSHSEFSQHPENTQRSFLTLHELGHSLCSVKLSLLSLRPQLTFPSWINCFPDHWSCSLPLALRATSLFFLTTTMWMPVIFIIFYCGLACLISPYLLSVHSVKTRSLFYSVGFLIEAMPSIQQLFVNCSWMTEWTKTQMWDNSIGALPKADIYEIIFRKYSTVKAF